MSTLRLNRGDRLLSDEIKLAANETFEEITLAHWRDGARPEAGRFALVLPNDADLEEVAETLAKFAAVILEFPSFADGRAYTQARLLRERYDYAGEVRARGDVLRDQALFMARAGFDAFEIEPAGAAGFLEALGEYSFAYQPANSDRDLKLEPAWRARARRVAAA